VQTTSETFLSVGELADRYGVKIDTVYFWNKKKTGPRYIRLGRQIRYPLSAVLAWEASRPQGGEVA
jgi:predicted DNA-binding transcriptional regulator AlpA